MRTHVAAGIERHARGSADRGLHIGVRKAHPALGHGVDIWRLQSRMSRTPQVIEPKLIAHDPENVFWACHVLYFGNCGQLMVRYRIANDNRVRLIVWLSSSIRL